MRFPCGRHGGGRGAAAQAHGPIQFVNRGVLGIEPFLHPIHHPARNDPAALKPDNEKQQDAASGELGSNVEQFRQGKFAQLRNACGIFHGDGSGFQLFRNPDVFKGPQLLGKTPDGSSLNANVGACFCVHVINLLGGRVAC